VVPEPTNGSRTIPDVGQPHLIHFSANSEGNGAKCAPGESGLGEMYQISSWPARASRSNQYRVLLAKMNTCSCVSHGRSWAVGSGRAPGRFHTTSLRRVQPSC